MISQKISFEKLLNTRDLGGMTGAGGRKVVRGKLYRSGHLYPASPNDLEKLSGLIDTSVDFRTEQECTEKPEPVIPGVTHIYLPIFEESRAGVTRDKDSFAEVRRKMLRDAKTALHYMTQTYEDLILNAYSAGQYERFVRLLLEDHPKGILWHCTAGKDRAGFASVIVQELLGISREDIAADYIYTNVCLKPEIDALTEAVSAMQGIDPEVATEGMRYIFAAHESYLTMVYDTVESHYGTFENYLRTALHITPAEQNQLRERYLEP